MLQSFYIWLLSIAPISCPLCSASAKLPNKLAKNQLNRDQKKKTNEI